MKKAFKALFLIIVLACVSSDADAMDRVTIHGDKFYAGGKEFRIWGVNVMYGLDLPETLLKQNMDRLAFLGVNFVRLHALDVTAWGLGDGRSSPGLLEYRPDTSRKLTNEAGFWRLLDALKEKNIYVDVNLIMARAYRPGDMEILKTTPEDEKAWSAAMAELNQKRDIQLYKLLPEFDERCLALTKEYAGKLLNLKHPKTGMKFGADPQLALLESINEISGYCLFSGGGVGHIYEKLPKYFQDKLSRRWNEYLSSKYGTQEQLKQAWTEAGRRGLLTGEDLAKLNIAFRPWEEERPKVSGERYNDLLHFVGGLDMAFQKTMADHYRANGFKGYTIYSFIDSLHGGLYERWKQSGLYPYYEDHQYDLSDTDYFRVKDVWPPKLVSCTDQDKRQYVWGKPYWRSEYRCLNWTRVVEPLYTAAYFSLTGLDGLTYFCWGMDKWRCWNDSFATKEDLTLELYNIDRDIPWQMMFRAAGRLYKSRQIKPMDVSDGRLNELRKASDLRTSQVYRNHEEGILTVQTPNFVAIAVDRPWKGSFLGVDIDITSGVCNGLVIEKISNTQYEVTAVGKAGKSFSGDSQKISFNPRTYVSGRISFKGRKVKTVTGLNDLGESMKTFSGNEGMVLLQAKVQLYRIELEP
jgi:hypothetical protein